jgi:GNAT superfamily N-acetyltransferase
MFIAEEEAEEGGIILEITTSNEDEQSITKAASFLVDAFWLDARHVVAQSSRVSEEAKRSLYQEQASDLIDKYGERMGKRLLDSCLLAAIDKNSGNILGLLCVSTLLLDTRNEQLIPYEDSEELLKAAVAGLGPKDRRKYKDAPVEEIASNLLGDRDLKAVCCISNLAVLPNARRLGIAFKLCDEAERIASGDWGCKIMVLKVEADNTRARNLYEQKLNYKVKCTEPSATAYRVDAEDGRFVELKADTLILAKQI